MTYQLQEDAILYNGRKPLASGLIRGIRCTDLNA